jgi:hypothetical protein
MDCGFKKIRKNNSYCDKPPNCKQIVFFWRFIFLSDFSNACPRGYVLCHEIERLEALKKI